MFYLISDKTTFETSFLLYGILASNCPSTVRLFSIEASDFFIFLSSVEHKTSKHLLKSGNRFNIAHRKLFLLLSQSHGEVFVSANNFWRPICILAPVSLHSGPSEACQALIKHKNDQRRMRGSSQSGLRCRLWSDVRLLLRHLLSPLGVGAAASVTKSRRVKEKIRDRRGQRN